MNKGVKRMSHLVARTGGAGDVRRSRRIFGGCNGQSPGPTIEVVEGDRVRIFVTNMARQR